MSASLYNVPYSSPFFRVLAQKFLHMYKDNPLGLSNVLFLLQNRRSCQNLKEAFLQANDLTPFLLPKIVPVYETDEDDVFFANEGLAETDLPAAVSREERLFLFAKMIAAQKNTYGIENMSYAQSLSLASYLGKLIDDALSENLSFENLTNIVPEQYAAHWQINLDFLKIVTAYWPDILKERGLIDACQRRNLLIKQRAAGWLKDLNIKVVAAGIGVPFDALKEVAKVLGRMENSEIYLYGLDKDMPNGKWENLSKTHPQYEKKELLDLLKVNRADVSDVAMKTNVNRENFVAEVMREAETTDCWRFLQDNKELLKGLNGVSLIEAADGFEEALAIAMIMRRVLETPGKTAALVTPDRNLARMVASALKRFGVEIDDSAGLPLHLSPIGIYLRQILDVVENDFSASSIAALLKNEFVRMGKSKQQIKTDVYEAEYEKRMPHYGKKHETPKQDMLNDTIIKFFADLRALYEKNEVSLETLIKTHITLAEKLAEDDLLSGAQNLWRHEDGRQCAAVVAQILEKASTAGCISPKEYSAVFLTLLSLDAVRKPYGTHPRLKILGLIEARFCAFDVMIAGSLNEGIWPKSFETDPFMSRAMKESFGLPAPEKQIAQTADDLCALLNAKEVYLTRALRVDDAPTNKSRYWLRIETVLKALGADIKDIKSQFYLDLAEKINQTEKPILIAPVRPTPPVSARPREFSASTFKKWMQSPYDIYADKILNLKKLDALDIRLKANDFGDFMHCVLEKFGKAYPKALDENAEAVLRQIAAEELDKLQIDSSVKVFWSGLIEKMIVWFLQTEPAYRTDISDVLTEVRGKITFKGPAGDVLLTARADRIDTTKDGFYQIVDYKTGSYPSNADVIRGFEPQLPLEGLIAQVGGFEKDGKVLPPRPVKKLLYFALGNKIEPTGESKNTDIQCVLEQTQERIEKMINVFDDVNTPYLYNPNPQNKNNYSDYEHLSRFKEWKGREN